MWVKMNKHINVYIDLSYCKEENKGVIEMLLLKSVILENVKSKYPAWMLNV